MTDRDALRSSIVRGVLATAHTALLAEEDDGVGIVMDEWCDRETGNSWSGPEVLEECKAVYAALEAWARELAGTGQRQIEPPAWSILAPSFRPPGGTEGQVQNATASKKGEHDRMKSEEEVVRDAVEHAKPWTGIQVDACEQAARHAYHARDEEVVRLVESLREALDGWDAEWEETNGPGAGEVE
jgi:hypothetical protein